MSSRLEEVEIPPSALGYIEGVLKNGNALSRELLIALPLTSGHVRAVLPHGALLPGEVNYELSLAVLPRESTRAVPSTAAVREFLCSNLARELSAHPHRLVVVEDRFALRGDASLEGAASARFFGDEVYYVLGSPTSEAEVDDVLRRGISWPSGIILCADSPQANHAYKFGNSLSESFFRMMTEGACWIAVTAFDGETCLVWRRHRR